MIHTDDSCIPTAPAPQISRASDDLLHQLQKNLELEQSQTAPKRVIFEKNWPSLFLKYWLKMSKQKKIVDWRLGNWKARLDRSEGARSTLLCKVTIPKAAQAADRLSTVSKLMVRGKASEAIPLEHLLIIRRLMRWCTAVQLGCKSNTRSGMAINDILRVCLVWMWLWKKLMWAVSYKKTIVGYELWESWKPFG
jgi:hypothetical protein